ncbi:MAG TPA: hypothetical protein VKN76_07200, partial [Kiloniellaceae bacterium]|nr:hypothetical protein [Kiloniellaceae bacterium]
HRKPFGIMQCYVSQDPRSRIDPTNQTNATPRPSHWLNHAGYRMHQGLQRSLPGAIEQRFQPILAVRIHKRFLQAPRHTVLGNFISHAFPLMEQ